MITRCAVEITDHANNWILVHSGLATPTTLVPEAEIVEFAERLEYLAGYPARVVRHEAEG